MIPAPLLINVQSANLSPDENQLAQVLSERLLRWRNFLQVREDYYEGEQRIRHLGIAVPEQLQALRTAVGWPRIAVDSIEERLDVQGFRMPDEAQADKDMWEIWTKNNMETESGLAHLDALALGRSFLLAGVSGDDGSPLITVESPFNLACEWDAVSRAVTEALQLYIMDGEVCAALYTQDSTIHMVQRHEGPFEVFERDDHAMGITPVVMLANRSRSHDRYGKSEISPEIMSMTDAACRTLLGMEIAREFFGSPQRYILGATEEAFQKPDGTPTSAWETYVGRVLALERDEEGNIPAVGTFAAADPTAYTNIMTTYAQMMSSITGLPPHYLGFSTEQPASAEAIRSSEARLDKRTMRKQRAFAGAWRDVMTTAMRLTNGNWQNAHKAEVMWAAPGTPTVQETTMSVLQQVQMGFLPATSDVTGEQLGYTPAERARIKEDRDKENHDQALSDIANALRQPRYHYTQAVRAGEAESGITTNIAKPAAPTSSQPGKPSGRAKPRT